MSEHTQGPWRYETTEATQNGLDHLINGPVDPVAWAYREENARLIAAAPRLFDALQKTLAYLQLRADGESNVLWAEVAAVLTDATGENVE